MTASNPRVNKLINTIKKSGVVDKDKSMGKDTKESLWANIRARRAAGKRKLKPGDKNYPKTLDVGEMVTTGDIPNPADTAMGPKLKPNTIHDRRKKKGTPKLLKRFADYYKDKGIG
tara:strand:- start:16230 stop:16577 length:348 start_codon:yes stop_codon:yes gene_type:complete